MIIGQVRSLSLRADRRALPVRVERAVALAGQGFEGDVHADPISPRQLLLASSSVYESLGLSAHTLRENLLVDVDTASLASGTILQIGAEARIRLMFACEACGQLDLQRPGLARALGNRRGMLARVVDGGTVVAGDTIVQLDERMPPWLDDWRARVTAVLDAAPPGSVVEYGQLARLAGIQSSYCRAFPRFLAKMGPHYANRAVAAGSGSKAPRWNGSGLFGQP